MCHLCKPKKVSKRCESSKKITRCDLPLVISRPGCYRVCEDLQFNPSAPDTSAITIDSSDVVLDFGCHRLYQGANNIQPSTGVKVTPGKNRISFLAKGGSINGIQGFGIHMQGPHDTVLISGLRISNCGTDTRISFGRAVDGGIKLGEPRDDFYGNPNADDELVTNLEIKDTSIVNCKNTGAILAVSDNVLLQDVSVNGTFSDVQSRTVVGIRLFSEYIQNPDPLSKNILFDRVRIMNTHCEFIRTFGNGVMGIWMTSSRTIRFLDCTFQGLRTRADPAVVSSEPGSANPRYFYACNARISGDADWICENCTFQDVQADEFAIFPQHVHSSANTVWVFAFARAARPEKTSGGLQNPINRTFKNCSFSRVFSRGGAGVCAVQLNYGSQNLFENCHVQDIVSEKPLLPNGRALRPITTAGFIIGAITAASGGDEELNLQRGIMGQTTFKDCTVEKVNAYQGYAGAYFIQGGMQPKFRDGEEANYFYGNLATQAGSSIITVTEADHGRSSGSVVGFASTIAGYSTGIANIPSSEIVGAQTITVIDNDTYTFQVTTVSDATVASGGGTWMIGKVLSNPFTATSGSNVVNVFEPAHGRETGSYVGLYGSSAVQGIPQSELDTQAFQITKVDADNYTIEVPSNATGTSVSGEGGDNVVRSLVLTSPFNMRNLSFINCLGTNVRSSFTQIYDNPFGQGSFPLVPIAAGVFVDRGFLYNYGYTFGSFDTADFFPPNTFYQLPDSIGDVYVDNCRFADIHGAEEGIQYSGGVSLYAVDKAQVINSSVSDSDNGIVLSGGTDQYNGQLTSFTSGAVVKSNCVDNSSLSLVVKDASVSSNVATLTLYSTVAQAGLAVGQTVTVSGIETGTGPNPYLGTHVLTAVSGSSISYSVISPDLPVSAQPGANGRVVAPQSTKVANYVDIPGNNVFVDNVSSYVPSGRHYVNVANVGVNGNRSF